jgi:hypothetical protein
MFGCLTAFSRKLWKCRRFCGTLVAKEIISHVSKHTGTKGGCSMKKIIAEFKEFISKGNVLDMAVGLIVGSAFTAVVTALVSFLRSLISCFNIWGEPDTSFLDIHFLNGTIQLSALVEAVVSFLIIAVAVFFLVKGVNFLRSRAKKEEEEKKEQAKPDPQLELLTEIRDLLRQQAQTSAPEQEILSQLEEEEHGH